MPKIIKLKKNIQKVALVWLDHFVGPYTFS